VQFLGACSKPPNLAMVMEYLPFSLFDVLHGDRANTPLDRTRVLALAADIARAFVYLHSRKPAVIHRDIKPANFLLDRAWRVKLCDMGLASNNQSGAGTPAYMAPELLVPEARGYNEKVDVYAFGVLLNEMVGRQQPFKGWEVGQIVSAVLAGQRPDVPLSCPRPLQDIITQCWQQQAAARPSFERVLQLLKDEARSGTSTEH
jgi:serine/threonine protein kinase